MMSFFQPGESSEFDDDNLDSDDLDEHRLDNAKTEALFAAATKRYIVVVREVFPFLSEDQRII
jgi:hypothetical protein